MFEVSVIIPVYNSARTLKKCVQSLINQTYKCKEIVLIDDGSLDSSWEVCRSLAEKYTNVFSYRVFHGGVSAARNYGIKISSGNLVSFVDSDDTVHKSFIEELVDLIAKGNNDLACCGYMEVISGKTKFRMARKKTEDKYLELFQNYQGFLCNKLYRMEIIKNKKLLFDEDITMSEDLLFNIEYLRECKKVGYSNKNYYFYHVSDNASSRTFREGWFDILTVYSRIMKDLPNMTAAAEDNLIKQYLFVLGEAKMRCRIMGIDFKKVCRERGLKLSVAKAQYVTVMKSKYIDRLEKIKLFLFMKLNYIAQIIKFRRCI